MRLGLGGVSGALVSRLVAYRQCYNPPGRMLETRCHSQDRGVVARGLLYAAPIGAALFMAACAGMSDNGGSARTEGALIARIEECADAFLHGDTAAAYACYHEDYRARCSLADFAGLRALFVLLFGIKPEDMEYRIESVVIDGDRGYVTTGGVYVDGEPVGTEKDEDEYWLWEDGQWWGMNDDPKPCSITSGDG